jgi:hypothetical protein
VKAFVIEIQRSGVWWAFDLAVFPVYASYAIRHFTNVVELICNSQPFIGSTDCPIYWSQYFPNGFSGLTYNALYRILSNSKIVPQRRKRFPSGKIPETGFLFQTPTNVGTSGTT